MVKTNTNSTLKQKIVTGGLVLLTGLGALSNSGCGSINKWNDESLRRHNLMTKTPTNGWRQGNKIYFSIPGIQDRFYVEPTTMRTYKFNNNTNTWSYDAEATKYIGWEKTSFGNNNQNNYQNRNSKINDGIQERVGAAAVIEGLSRIKR